MERQAIAILCRRSSIKHGFDEALLPDFASKLPGKEKDVFDLTTEQGQKWANSIKKNKKQ